MKLKGFTLIELLVAIAIVALIAALAIITYTEVITKARFTEIVTAANPYQKAVAFCYEQTQNLSQCNNGQNGIPSLTRSNQGLIRSIRVSQGIITIIPNNFLTISRQDRLVYQPTVTPSGTITWRASGQAVSKGYVSQ